MRHQKGNKRLNRPTGHRILLLRNLASDFFVHGHIKTTEVKAKEAQRVVEKLITLAKVDTIHTKRQVRSFINQAAYIKLYDKVGELNERTSGYTRIVKLHNRRGDNAPVVLLSFVE